MNIAQRDEMRESRLASAVLRSQAESDEAFSVKRAHYNRKVVRDDKLHMPQVSLPSGRGTGVSSGQVFIRLIDTAVGINGMRRLAPRDAKLRRRDNMIARARMLGDKRFGVKLVAASPEMRAQAKLDADLWQAALTLAQPWREEKPCSKK